MSKKRSSFLSMGIPSMCIIFSVLCLVILSLLTLGTSRQDLQISQLTLDQTTAYYEACSSATQKYQEVADYAKKAFKDSQTSQDYDSKMASIVEQYPDVIWDSQIQILSFTVDFSDEQAIYIEIKFPYKAAFLDMSGTSTSSPKSDSDTSSKSAPDTSSDSDSDNLTPELLTWKTISTANWNPDTRQPVYKGDTK